VINLNIIVRIKLINRQVAKGKLILKLPFSKLKSPGKCPMNRNAVGKK
jgi:hypothetical protein